MKDLLVAPPRLKEENILAGLAFAAEKQLQRNYS